MRLGHRKKKGANETMVNQYDLSKGAKRLEEVEPSLIRTILDRATALRGEGKSVIPFSAGEPDFNTPSTSRKQLSAPLPTTRPNTAPTEAIRPCARY